MSKSTNGIRKAGLASLAVTLTLGAGLAGAGAANADADFEFTRIGGDNRYATAALVADEYMTASTDEVILVNGEAGYFADALTANYLSGSRNAPILLTRDEFMPDATQDQLDEMDPAKVTIVGGEGVVPQEQADALEAAGYTVERIAGDDRFQTNAEVLEAVGATTRDTGIVATGWDFADALGAGPAVYQDRPLGLTKEDDIDDDVVQGLKDSGVTKIIVLGGPDVVGPEVVAELETAGFDVERIFGDDRSGTSAEFADYAIAEFGFTDTAADVASGYTLGSGADALAGGPLTGERNRPMLITKSARSAGDLPAWFEANAETLTEGVIYGLYGAVSAAIEDELEAAARTVTSNQSYTVSPDGAIEKPTSTDTTTNEGAVTFSFGDVDKAVKVALLPASNVTEDANGVVSFEDSDGTANEADDLGSTETGEAQIEQVNGAAYVAGTAVNPVNGNVSVVVDSEGFDQAIVVVYNDADGDGQLDLDANNQPAEDFAVGGPVTWLPGEAANGTDNSVDVLFVDKTRDFFVGDDQNLYYYESSDLFLYNEDDYSISFQEWEQALSVGDSVDTYTDELEGYSRTARSGFDLYDDIPGTPTNVATAVGDFDTDSADTGANDVRVTWSAPSPLNGLIQGYDVYQVGAPDTLVASVDADEFSAVVEDLAVGDYQFYVVAKSYTNTDGDASANAKATVAVPPAPASVPGAPESTSASFQDNNSNGVVDGADVLFVTFNEAMAAPNAGDSITLEDADGTAGIVTNGLNSTWSLSENKRTLTISMGAAPVVDAVGTVTGVNYPATAVDSDGVTDTGAENVDDEPLEWDIAGSSDVDFGSAPPAP